MEPLVRAPDGCGGSLVGRTSGLDTIHNNGVEQPRRTMTRVYSPLRSGISHRSIQAKLIDSSYRLDLRQGKQWRVGNLGAT